MIITRTAPFLLLLSLASPVAAQPAPGLDRPLLVHGNYCGPGNNAPLPPIDALDAACARHDACTPPGGLPSQACNRRLEREAAAIARDPRQSDELRATAGFISAGVALIPSDEMIRPASHRLGTSLPGSGLPTSGLSASQVWDAPADAED
ncbi:hypothetical protein [Methylobacterium sp. J-090]|uniref:hypothetical protein n=1 Tax=Methylobacterium sp. J-090 TaxID=2836666 RepID=UPI001FBB754B|nr:hypothetical protein [Methylobacterium sp. J-090]MCJ2084043.1 hypothetical protein [Methylobacterium sp. J-090]